MLLNKMSLIFVFIILLLASFANAKNYELEYQVSQTRELEGKIDKSKYTSSIIFTPNKVLVSNDKNMVDIIYDFKEGSIISIGHKKKIYQKSPIFFLVDFNAKELLNVEFLSKASAQMRNLNSNDLFNGFYEESTFRIKTDKNYSKSLAQKNIGNNHIFTFNNEELVSFIASDNMVPKDIEKSFRLYLTYNHAIHPLIQEAIVKAAKFPQKLDYKSINLLFGEVIKTEYNLISLSEYKGEINIPANYKEEYANIDWLNSSIKKIDNRALQKSPQQYLQEIENLLSSNIIEAYFAMYELGVEYPTESYEKNIDREQLKQTATKIFENEEVIALQSEMQPRSKEEAENAVIIFEKFAKKDLKHAYVANLILGNLYRSLGKLDQAKENFKVALMRNPFLTAAYLDLGDMYNDSYENNLGWVCYAAARKIHPGNQKIENKILKLENKLKTLYSNYF